MPAAKQRLSREVFSGRVTQWKNTYGWIEPLEPIDHPEIKRHQGKIFVHSDDISNGKKQLRVGCICEFFLYLDDQGLGADEVLSRQVVRILMPTAEAKQMFESNGAGVPAFEDRHNVSLRVYEWYNNDGSAGTLPFLIECWGRPESIISAVKEFKNRSNAALAIAASEKPKKSEAQSQSKSTPSSSMPEGEFSPSGAAAAAAAGGSGAGGSTSSSGSAAADSKSAEGSVADVTADSSSADVAKKSEQPACSSISADDQIFGGIDFLVPQSRLWLLDLDKMRE